MYSASTDYSEAVKRPEMDGRYIVVYSSDTWRLLGYNWVGWEEHQAGGLSHRGLKGRVGESITWSGVLPSSPLLLESDHIWVLLVVMH